MNLIEQLLSRAREDLAIAKEAKGKGFGLAYSIALDNAQSCLKSASYYANKEAQRKYAESEGYRKPEQKKEAVCERNRLSDIVSAITSLYSLRQLIESIGYSIFFGFAWVFCVIEDKIWDPIWWFFNKRKYARK